MAKENGGESDIYPDGVEKWQEEFFTAHIAEVLQVTSSVGNSQEDWREKTIKHNIFVSRKEK